MRYIYRNSTNSTKLLALISQSKTSSNHISLGPGARIEIDYPGLDVYVPHILSRLDESGSDISQFILEGIEANKAAILKADKDDKSKSIEDAPRVPVIEGIVNVPKAEVVTEQEATVAEPVQEKTKRFSKFTKHKEGK